MSPSDHSGRLVLFLHAHLPFVRHPEHPSFLEEDWLYEAITETYLPCLNLLRGWHLGGLPVRLTMSITPTLCAMLSDELLMKRYIKRVKSLAERADAEAKSATASDQFRQIAEMYRERLLQAIHDFEHAYQGNLIGAFRRYQDEGLLEIVTSAATHAFLPYWNHDPAFVRAQVRMGVRSYQQHFGRHPPGIWLPECGYSPGVDQILADENLCYFFVDSHAVTHADPPAAVGTYAPIVCPSGVLAFPRDRASSVQVWSKESGYPGAAPYREFYRDLGHDHGEGRDTGLKFHAVTGKDVPLDQKALYVRTRAVAQAATDAAHFVSSRLAEVRKAAALYGRSPVVVAPYDAELFGHWWYEGPEFLGFLVEQVLSTPGLELCTPHDVISTGMAFQQAVPAPSSWGRGGYGEVWCNPKNDWIWPRLHAQSARFQRDLEQRPGALGSTRRVLNQMVRELFLASASDWPFMMAMDTTAAYAESRLRTHLGNIDALRPSLLNGTVDEVLLDALEAKSPIFPNVDYRDFC